MPGRLPRFTELSTGERGGEFDPAKWGPSATVLSLLFLSLLLVGLSFHLGLVHGGPPLARLLLAWGWIVLAPGFFLTRAAGLGAGLRSADVVAVAAALGLTVVGALAWVASLAGLPLHWLPRLAGATTALAALLGLSRPFQWRGAQEPRRDRGISLALVATALLVGAVLLHAGGTLRYAEDGLAHAAALRAAVEEDTAFPTSIWYREGEVPGPDPRFGAGHAILAVMSRESGMDPVEVWLRAPGLVTPFLFLAFALWARVVFPAGEGAWTVAAVLFLVGFGGFDPRGFRQVGDPIFAALLVNWVGAALFLRGLRARRRRGMTGGALLAGGSVFMHIYGVVHAAASFGSFALAAMVTPGGGRWGREGLRAFVVAVVAAAPYLAHRYLTSYRPANPNNYLPQDVLQLGKHFFVLSPQEALGWFGYAGLAALLLLPWMLRRCRGEAGLLFITSNAIFGLLVVGNPFGLPLVYRVVSYLALRLKYLIPALLLLAWGVTSMARAVRFGPLRLPAAAGLALLLFLFLPTMREHRSSFRASVWSAREGPLVWQETLQRLDRQLEGDRVFATDAYSAYAIPAFTHHRVTAIPVDHASPNDAHPVERLRGAADILSPYVSLEETRAKLVENGVDFVLLNRSHTELHEGYEFTIRPDRFDDMRRKFDAHPELFARALEDANVVMYEVLPAAATAGATGPDMPPPPMVVPAAAAGLENSAPLLTGPGGLALLRFEITPARAEPGETVQATAWWRRVPQSGGAERVPWIWVYLRGLTPYPEGVGHAEAWGKLYRFALERQRGERYRFRVRHTPTGGLYPPHRWRAGEIVRDSWSFTVPPRMAAGEYRIEMRVVQARMARTFRLSDFVREQDTLSGETVGRLRVGPPSFAHSRERAEGRLRGGEG